MLKSARDRTLPRAGTGLATALHGFVAVVVLAVVSGASALVVELSFATAVDTGRYNYLTSLGARTLAVEALLIGIMVVGLVAVTGRLRLGIAVWVTLASLLMGVNAAKMRFRGEPLYPSDFAFASGAGLLVDSVGMAVVVGIVVVPLLLGLLAWFVTGLITRPWRTVPLALPRVRLVGRVMATLTAAGLVAGVFAFHHERNPLRTMFESTGADWVTWSQRANYVSNGFLAGFLYNMPAGTVPAPDGYDEARVTQVVEKYSQRARQINASRAGALDSRNVVIILGETFIDPLHIEGLVLEEDPIPFTRQLMDRTPSGTMRALGFGGGTANVEFEVLTGMAVGNFPPQLQVPYQALVSQSTGFPSLLWRLEGTHHSLGLHPFHSDFYRRGDAYRALGFDEARFYGDMTSTWQAEGRGYVADAATYEELVAVLRDREEPVLANVITMQNHLPYGNLYADPIEVVQPASGGDPEGMGQFLRGLRHSDQALEQLFDDLTALGEDTVVLFYGDHLPTGFPEELWDSQPDAQFETPWFVWGTDIEGRSDADGTLSAVHLWNELLAATGAPVTPWDALLLDVQQIAPVVGRAEGLPAVAQAVLGDYALLQYDVAVGSGFSRERLFSPPATVGR